MTAGEVLNLDLTLDYARLVANALYAPGGPKVERGAAFELRKKPGIEGGDGKSVDTQYGAESKFGAPAGNYVLVATVGRATAQADVDLTSGGLTTAEIVMNAGVLGWKGGAHGLCRSNRGQGEYRRAAQEHRTQYDDEGNMAFNAGDYVLVAGFPGDVKKEFPFTIKAGERTEVVIGR